MKSREEPDAPVSDLHRGNGLVNRVPVDVVLGRPSVGPLRMDARVKEATEVRCSMGRFAHCADPCRYREIRSRGDTGHGNRDESTALAFARVVPPLAHGFGCVEELYFRRGDARYMNSVDSHMTPLRMLRGNAGKRLASVRSSADASRSGL